jgi:hypothetical protein
LESRSDRSPKTIADVPSPAAPYFLASALRSPGHGPSGVVQPLLAERLRNRLEAFDSTVLGEP